MRWALARTHAAEPARMDEVFVASIAAAEAEALRLAGAPGTPELRAYGVVAAPLRGAVCREGLAATALAELSLAS